MPRPRHGLGTLTEGITSTRRNAERYARLLSAEPSWDGNTLVLHCKPGTSSRVASTFGIMWPKLVVRVVE
jgi:hypothetical protein